jgi:O-antigen/teichoic acid export membrane protein
MRNRIDQVSRSRLRRRVSPVILNAANSLLIPLLSPIVSLAVVRLAGASLWGDFVGVLIVVQLVAHVVAWGNKEYLLRRFSFSPAQAAQAWQSSLVTRLLLFAVPLGVAVVLELSGFASHWLAPAIAWTLGLVVYQSFDVIVLYKRSFAFSAAVELAGLGLTLAAILQWQARIDLDSLVVLFGVVTWLKAMAVAIRFRRPFLAGAFRRPLLSGRFDRRYFAQAFPFFALGLTGLLQSRIDLYTANHFLPRDELAQYQVFMTFVLMLQSVSNFVLAPFVKNIYRAQMRSILDLSPRLLALGVLVVLPGLLAVWAIMDVHYGFDLPSGTFVLGGIAALPIFFYLPMIYALYKVGAQSEVVKINLVGVGVSFALSVALLPRVGLAGAVGAAAAAQCCMAAAYALRNRSLRAGYGNALPDLS